jgi:hypothetical protein
MRIAIVAAGFTPDEADKLRRAMATFRHVGTIHTFREKFIAGMAGNGYEREFAERCFSQIEGFGEYGFPESHAASFAHLVYVSSWIKHHYPDVFCAAILNSQPMGFYQPAQLVRDAREHGVEVRHPDINASDWDCTLEEAVSKPHGFPPPGGGRTERHGFSSPITMLDAAADRRAKSDGVPGGGDGPVLQKAPPPDAPNALAPLQGASFDCRHTQAALTRGASSSPLQGEGKSGHMPWMWGVRGLVSINPVRAQTRASRRSGLLPFERPSAAKSHIWRSSSGNSPTWATRPCA